MPEMETLRCKAGHEFQRPRVRGPKPEWCPDHKPKPATPEKPLIAPDARLELARQAKASKRLTVAQQTAQQVEKLLGSPNIDDEMKRKLIYAHRYADVNPLMATVRGQLIQEATRGR